LQTLVRGAQVSWVPQGSILGPSLFLLYINDVADIFTDLTVSLSLFADDLKLYSDCTVDATHSDLQAANNRLTEWAKKWQLQISISKCSAFRIKNTQWNLANEIADLTYNIDGHVLPFTDHIHGVLVWSSYARFCSANRSRPVLNPSRLPRRKCIESNRHRQILNTMRSGISAEIKHAGEDYRSRTLQL